MPKRKANTKEQKKLHIEIVKQMIQLSTSGFGLVAALAWNNLIKDFIDKYIDKWLPQGGSLLSLFIYAVAITVLAVFVTLQLSKLLQELEKRL